MSPADLPVLVACAHGTRSPAGRRAIARLRLDVAALRPGVEVLAAHIDVQRPSLADVLGRLARAGRRGVVVPLLLSAGYHVAVDVADAVAASGGLAVAADALGPDPTLVDVLLDRLAEAGAPPEAAVVLAAAGSSDPLALADVTTTAQRLAARRGGPVAAAYLSAAAPRVAAVLQALPEADRVRACVAAYLLAPGHFTDRLTALAADLGVGRVTAPLAPHPALARLVLRRYDEALRSAVDVVGP